MNGATQAVEPPEEAHGDPGLSRRALSLGAANAIDYLVQFLLPVVLVRCLDPGTFGQYRLLWLAVGTVMAIVTQAVPGSLFYFLPRLRETGKRLFINQTLLFLFCAGCLGAFAVSPLNPWLPAKVYELAQHSVLVPAFVLLWVMSSMLDLLATAEERVMWQARVIVTLSGLRALSLSVAAFVTHEFEPVLWALLLFVLCKLGLLLHYIARHHGLKGPVLRWRALADQLRQCAPFGASSALYSLRLQADQWIAAAQFSVGMFASFSIGPVLAPLVQLCRQSVLQAFLPSASRLQAAGDVRGMIGLNSRANVMVAGLVYPLLGFAFVFAEEIVTLVYTGAYVDAAAVMRVYIVGLAALVIELTTVMLLLRQGAYTLMVSLVTLIASVLISWLGAHYYGLAGAAYGSVAVIYLDLFAMLWRISQCTRVPLRQLQDWPALLQPLLWAVGAALLAELVADHAVTSAQPLPRLIVGALVLGLFYGSSVLWLGNCRDWVAALRWRAHKN